MQISGSVGQTAPFGSISKPNVNNKLNTDHKDSVRLVDPDVEQEQSASKQAQASIVIDEQAIALFKENQQANSNNFSAASQDQPSTKSETAVASYQAIDNLAQRESVQALFGVDLFA